MQRHPAWGWRSQCVLIVGGLAGCAGVPQNLPVSLVDRAEPPVEIVLTAAKGRATAPPIRPQSARPVQTQPTPVAAPAPVDVLADARTLEQAGRLPEAQRAYQTLLQSYPQNVECMHRLAVVCTRMNDYGTAQVYYDRALQIAPQSVPLLTDAGYARYLAGDHRTAESLLQRAVTLSPRDVRATNNLAVVLGVSGKFDDSLKMFQQVNGPAAAWTNMAYVYQLRQEPELALNCYQSAREIDATIQIPSELLALKSREASEFADLDLPPAPSGSPSKAVQHPLVTIEDPTDSPFVAQTEPQFEDPVVVPAETPTAEASAAKPAPLGDDPFQLSLEAPAEQTAVPDAAAPKLDGTNTVVLDEQDAAHIATEKAKLELRASLEGLKGFCLVALKEERRLVDAQGAFTVEYQAQSYQFSSSDAADKFKAEPEKYAPAAGGLDVVAVRQGRDVTPGSLDYAVWYRNRMYMFSSQQHKDEFRANPRMFVSEK